MEIVGYLFVGCVWGVLIGLAVAGRDGWRDRREIRRLERDLAEYRAFLAALAPVDWSTEEWA